MGNTSARELAQDIVESCLYDGTWPARALDRLVERALDEDDVGPAMAATQALFGIIIERLADLFDEDLCDVYARLFAHIISRALPQYDPGELVARYRQVRQPHSFAGGSIERVFILSRITLGADVAVTSVALDAAKRRFPASEICLVGPEKNLALFASDTRIVPVVFEYGRSNLLRQRLTAGLQLREVVDRPASIVIDPDSRLTQLGLIPTCDDSRYHFFESRSYGGNSEDGLPLLTADWLSETFGVSDARPYLAPEPVAASGETTVSLGVGENLEKRVADEFEYQLLRFLLERSDSVLLDRGAGGEEAERVNALVERLGQPANLKLHDGSYAAFASHILQSRLYVGYDSAGQHVAAAGHIPFVSIFKGFPCERMFFRWKPTGRSGRVIRVEGTDADEDVLARTLDAIAEVAAGH